MLNIISDKAAQNTSNNSVLTAILPAIDYAQILVDLGVQYTASEYYWQIGDIQLVEGWIIHLSIIRSQIADFLQEILPFLIEESVPFKIIQNASLADDLSGGHLGTENIGKFIKIYPPNDHEAVGLVRKLFSKTKLFRGPAVPTDICLGGIVYTRYGAFNPVLLEGPDGKPVKHIHGPNGKLMPDLCIIPFSMPSGVNWPFQEFASPKIAQSPILLNYIYYPIFTYKKDFKGDVIRALYFKKFYHIASCVIKQGRKNMTSDDGGRDMRDRLRWQYILSERLVKHIPLPRVLAQFEYNEDAYLVMECISGISLRAWIDELFNSHAWFDLPRSIQNSVIDRLDEIVNIVQRIHENNIVHRDLTPENFLIDKKGFIHLIDLELAWSAKENTPSPPFRLGTPGFMSPEQLRVDTPTVKEDIYTLGALMLASLTNLCPSKFIGQSSQQLRKNINIFIPNELLASTIARCMNNNPVERPNLCDIQNDLKLYRSQLQEKVDRPPLLDSAVDSKELCFTIQAGLYGLTNPGLSTSKKYWLSYKHSQDTSQNKTRDMTLYEGWHTGIAGPLWFIAISKRLFFNVSQCEMTYSQNWRHVQNKFLTDRFSFDSSLYSGGAGIAMAIAEGIESGLLSKDLLSSETLELCFAKTPDLLTLSQGIAGQGIALLRVSSLMNTSHFADLLKTYITRLLDAQQSDGSWKQPSTAKHNNFTSLGISDGVSGIILFLLACIQYNENENLIPATTKALNWLIKKARKKGNLYTWPSLKKGKLINHWSMANGIPGITLLLIKAFQVLKKDIYKEIAEANLMVLPQHPVRWDFSLDSGLAGVGELYLEAYKAFGNPLWQQRATWIAKIFMNSYYSENSEERHWIIENRSSPTADLYVGNAGILHYLAYYANPDKLSFPLWPNPTKP